MTDLYVVTSAASLMEYPWIWTSETAFKLAKCIRVIPCTHINQVSKPNWVLLEPYEVHVPLDTLTHATYLDGDIPVLRWVSDANEDSAAPEENNPVYSSLPQGISRVRSSTAPLVHIVTATMGDKMAAPNTHLYECMKSVAAQSHVGVAHWIVVDGYRQSLEVPRDLQYTYTYTITQTLQNTGTVNNTVVYFGHRIYAAMSILLTYTYITFLDDDNIVEPNHITSLVQAAQRVEGAYGSYCFRNIMDEQGQFQCRDEFESVGCLAPIAGYFLCDTSTFLLTQDAAVKVAPQWFSPVGDRAVSRALFELNKFMLVPTYKFTLNYRLRSSKLNVGFFTNNRHLTLTDPCLWVCHFTEEATRTWLQFRNEEFPSPFTDWMPYHLMGLSTRFQVFSGYCSLNLIPLGATILVHLFSPDHIPWERFKLRPDLRIIVYTVESPNVRHQAQWDYTWLKSWATHIITYWKPMLQLPNTIECQFHKRLFLNRTQLQTQLVPMREWDTRKPKVMVLENRAFRDTYTINQVELHSLDYLRREWVEKFGDVDVVGASWKGIVPEQHILFQGANRMLDTRRPVDYMSQYKVAVIIENCDAEGYVSEKIYDAWIAGCVPLYLGGDLPDDEENLVVRLNQVAQIDSTALEQRVRLCRERIELNRKTVLSKYLCTAYADWLSKHLYPLDKVLK